MIQTMNAVSTMNELDPILFANDDPFALFAEWMAVARTTPGIAEPTAMSLATADAHGLPSVRIVLCKEHGPDGLVFFTNYEGRKSRELAENPNAAACFYWMPLDRQVRFVGRVEKLDAAASDAYFATRPRERQIGAITSRQSSPLASRETFMAELAETEKRFEDGPVPRPASWGGWRIIPHEIEFWLQLPHRYHERRQFLLQDGQWVSSRLYP